jgi:ABC-type transporter Mla subunit MlaD
MSHSPHHFKLGLFIVIAGILLLASLVTLGAASFFEKKTIVETCFDESVSGLDVGAPIKYRGVTIGRVNQIGFARTKYGNQIPDTAVPYQDILVEMAIDPTMFSSPNTPAIPELFARMVKGGLRIRLATAGLAGGTYLEANYVNPQTFPPPKLDWTPQGLYIPSAPSEMNQVVSGLESIVDQLQKANVDQVSHHVDQLIVDADRSVNDLNVADLQKRAVALLDEVRSSNAQLKAILQSPKVTASVNDLPEITAQIKSASAHIDAILSDKRLDRMMSGMSDASAQAGPAISDLRGVLQELDRLIAGQSDDFRAIISSLRETIDNARAITNDARDNPSRLLLGNPPPHVEK